MATTPATNQPLGDLGPLVKGMLDKGVSPEAIARFAKLMGYEVAFGFCYHLEDPINSYEGFPKEEEELCWRLFLTDPESNKPIEDFPALHESILSMDPSGRELRPRTTQPGE